MEFSLDFTVRQPHSGTSTLLLIRAGILKESLNLFRMISSNLPYLLCRVLNTRGYINQLPNRFLAIGYCHIMIAIIITTTL
jgi:hypothetical protein